MERAEAEKSPEDGSQLNRNRSFKSKQLVRSQAIRESQSPPRTISPSPAALEELSKTSERAESLVDECEKDSCEKKQQVEIQITSGNWESESSEQRLRARRWLGHRQSSDLGYQKSSDLGHRQSSDLLSNNPRVSCVCGACANCPHCRGRRRRHICTIKQDSGIACSEDCPDCSDTENTGQDSFRKSESVEAEKLEEQIYYCRCPERKERPKNISLSRTDSDDRSEPTGPELVNFIKETLNKNARDRMTLLKIEKELHALVNDTGRCVVRFPVMSSYGRMLVHRAAALFQLSHHLDHATKTAVLVSKTGTSGGRIPCTNFKQWCTATFPPSPHRSILKRDTNSLDEPGSGSSSNSRSKSLEQREKDYERMKRRIFTEDNCSQDEAQWPWLNTGPVKLLTPEAGRNKLIKVHSLECSQPGTSRGPVSKSHSFGGYAAVEPHPRVLSRQGDLASSSWRLSPSSSGYKTLSLRSTDSVTPSPTGGASPEPCGLPGGVVCAVTDMGAVPPGALVINPQTGRPLTNPDGSLYHFDPANPPVLYDATYHEKIDQNNEKKRGKLEKQHSFIDNECECQPSEETRNKCCCACRLHDTCHRNTDKNTSDQSQPPPSPSKNRYEQTDIQPDSTYTDTDTKQNVQENSQYETKPQTYQNESYENYERFEANQRPPFENPTNQRPPYEVPTNQRPPFEVPVNQRPYDASANQRQVYEASANQRQTYEVTTNQRPPYETSTNQRPPYETSPNQRPPYVTSPNQRPPYEPSPNQRSPYDASANQRSFEQANQSQRTGKLVKQESQECYQQNYGQIKNEEVTSPPIHQNYPQQDMNLQHIQAKTTPLPMPDPHIRPVSLTNMAYPGVHQGFQYMNHFRMDPSLQHMYHHSHMVQGTEDHKLNATPSQEPTFRIDPSYPYAAVDFGAQCGACVDPNTMRSYNMPYGQVEVPQVLPTYPMGNMMLQHIQMPYQDAVQWQAHQMMPLPPKLVVPEMYPMYPNMYQYNLLYPPVIPQPYPICQPVYGMVEKPPSRSNSVASANANVHASTFASAHSEHGEDRAASTHSSDNNATARRNSNEIAAKIQQIKDQMAQLNTRDRDRSKRNEDWKRRNNGNGILGNYPVNHVNGRIDRVQGTSNDETQLSSAARAIVNSIRNMQAKTNNYQDRREYQYRPDYRRRERDDRLERDNKPPDRNRNILQYRPPYLLRQMSPGTWCRRSPGPVHPVLNHPRRPNPDTRNGRR